MSATAPVYDLAKEEREIQRKSVLYTALIMFLFGVLCWFWFAALAQLLPPEEKQYEIVGSIDFGDLSEGSQEVNNFLPTTDNASDNPPSEVSPVPVEAQQPTEEVIATDQAAETQVAPVVEKKKKKLDWAIKSGGANDGESDKTGNKGSPDAAVLNPDGMYAFGSGSEGLQGRRILAQPKPVYTTQEDSRIIYEIVISPNGNVKEVIPKTLTSASSLTQAGKDALRKWKFNDISSNPAAREQRLKVTITFKLK